VKVVLDTSAAVEVALNRKRAAELARILADAEVVIAPDLLIPEVTNVIWKYHQLEDLDLASCEKALTVALTLPDRLVATIELHSEAFLLARTLRRPAYDMFYLALARREDAALMTLDSALRKEAQKQGLRIA
jgi:predicted nucleic acid-binding protein